LDDQRGNFFCDTSFMQTAVPRKGLHERRQADAMRHLQQQLSALQTNLHRVEETIETLQQEFASAIRNRANQTKCPEHSKTLRGQREHECDRISFTGAAVWRVDEREHGVNGRML
jgi:septal ring factor EnvC (AmiA/AmiB activator)